MRLIGAGLFVCADMLLLVVLLGNQKAPSWLVGSGIAIVMLSLMVVALWLFNPKWSDPFGRRTAEEHRRALEELGLLESTTFRATRAFGVEEVEDEGLHFFLELTDGRVLFLSGQYLYDYEPNPDTGTAVPVHRVHDAAAQVGGLRRRNTLRWRRTSGNEIAFPRTAR
jgi:hypothetical protein